MAIKMTTEVSQKDERTLHLSCHTMFGLGREETIAVYYPSTNILKVSPNYAGMLPKILKAVGKYTATEQKRYSLITVKYWA